MGREVVHDQFAVLDHASHGLGAGRVTDEILGQHHRLLDALGNRDRGLTLCIGLIPLVEHFQVIGRVGTHVGDLDSHGAVVGDGGVAGALLQVEGLVDGAVDIQHEVDAQPAVIVQHVEAGLAQTADVVMDNELVNHALQLGQIPAAAAHAFDLLRRKVVLADAVAIGRAEGFRGVGRLFPTALGVRAEAPLDPVGVVPTRVHPGDDAGAGVKQLTGHHDLVAFPRHKRARSVAAREHARGEGETE